MLNPLAEFVIHWRWLPVAPDKQDLKQAFVSCSLSDLLPKLPADKATMEAFRANFSSIAARTPDPLLYALVRVFNTPLLNITLKEAYQRNFSFWEGVTYREQDKGTHAHLWTMSIEVAGSTGPAADLIVAEYRFDGTFWLHSNSKPLIYLEEAYRDLANRMDPARNAAPEIRST